MKLKKADIAKVEGGDWIDDIPEMGDLRLRTRGMNNARFRSMQAELIRAFPRGRRIKGAIPPAELQKINGACLAETTLLEWDNLEGEDGAPLPYSKEQAKAFLTDPAYQAFYDAVLYAATIVGEDDAEADKADEGNSATA